MDEISQLFLQLVVGLFLLFFCDASIVYFTPFFFPSFYVDNIDVDMDVGDFRDKD